MQLWPKYDARKWAQFKADVHVRKHREEHKHESVHGRHVRGDPEDESERNIEDKHPERFLDPVMTGRRSDVQIVVAMMEGVHRPQALILMLRAMDPIKNQVFRKHDNRRGKQNEPAVLGQWNRRDTKMMLEEGALRGSEWLKDACPDAEQHGAHGIEGDGARDLSCAAKRRLDDDAEADGHDRHQNPEDDFRKHL